MYQSSMINGIPKIVHFARQGERRAGYGEANKVAWLYIIHKEDGNREELEKASFSNISMRASVDASCYGMGGQK